MSKPVLGRGLGQLMSGQKVPAHIEQATTAQPAQSSEASPGLGTLLRGKLESQQDLENNPFVSEPAPPKLPVTWFFLKCALVFADLLLLVPMSLYVLTKKAPLTFWEAVLCVVTFAFAASLGCLALVIHQHENK